MSGPDSDLQKFVGELAIMSDNSLLWRFRMKRQDPRLRATTVAKMSLLSCSLLLSIATGNAFDHSGMYKSRSATPDGPAYMLPQILPIHRFDLEGKPSVGADAGRLKIDVKGNAKLYILNSKLSSMKKLDTNLAKEILGVPVGPHGEDDNKPYYWTFHVLAIEPFEQNIYHIDVQFADAEQHWKEYRVRGYRIANPQWQLVE